MLAAASITDGERILDFGCGNGQSARDAARATPDGFVLGADLSAAMLDQARQQAEAEGVRNIEFVQADAGRDMPTPPPGAPSPFGLADPELARTWLAEAGFIDIDHEAVRGRFLFGAHADDATAFARRTSVAQSLLANLDDASKAHALDALSEAMQAHMTPDGVLFDSAAWFITARRP